MKRSRWVEVALFLLGVAGLAVGYWMISHPQSERCTLADISELPSAIQGVRMHFCYDRNNFFPPEWLREPPNCEGAQVDLVEAERLPPIVEQFASTYGTSFMGRDLRDLYLVSELRCFGRSFGGTNGTAAVYIKVGAAERGFTDEFLLSMLHSEFSSILMRNYSFPRDEWENANPPGFAYSENAVQVVEESGQYELSEELLADGFLAQYATTSIENDFNILASWLFTRQSELCQYAERYEAIKHKANLAIQFYNTIDPEVAIQPCPADG